ncbi:MAG: hypothetical protein H7235_07530 [Bdellovibrionaceae bacterium]|nr:hypothetical protein [Pseudobdellovibrionaceae bacterium]
MKYLAGLILLVVLHTFPLWDLENSLAGGFGDPFAHAAIGEWFCKNVVTGDFNSKIYMSPYGIDFSGNYDSPFPFIATCPFVDAGPLFQFHLFTILQLLLIVISSLLVASVFLRPGPLRFCYALFAWWGGFYLVWAHQHMTLLSLIWGFQFLIYAIKKLQLSSLKSCLTSATLIALTMSGTFQNIATLGPFALALVVYYFFTHRDDFKVSKNLINFFSGLVLTVVISLLFWSPMIVFTLKHGAPDLAVQRSLFSLDLTGIFLPFKQNLFYQWFEMGPGSTPIEKANGLDILIFISVILSLVNGRLRKDTFQIFLLVTAVFYLIISLGPEIHLNGQVIASMPFTEWVFRIFPFSLSRTPSRMAAITHLIFILLGFLYFDQIKKEKTLSLLVIGLLSWTVITGPILNQTITFPVINYRQIFTMNGLEALKSLPADSTILMIPNAHAQDPAQNFHRLFHHKNISSGYLAFPAYTTELRSKILSDPLLGQFECIGNKTTFARTELFQNPERLHAFLKEQRYSGIIINKYFISSNSGCGLILNWIMELSKQSWFKIVEENNYFVTALIL